MTVIEKVAAAYGWQVLFPTLGSLVVCDMETLMTNYFYTNACSTIPDENKL